MTARLKRPRRVGMSLRENAFILRKKNIQLLLDALPVESAHFEEFADLHSEPNTQSVAQQHVHNYRVPPTFREVWQEMGKDDLK